MTWALAKQQGRLSVASVFLGQTTFNPIDLFHVRVFGAGTKMMCVVQRPCLRRCQIIARFLPAQTVKAMRPCGGDVPSTDSAGLWAGQPSHCREANYLAQREKLQGEEMKSEPCVASATRITNWPFFSFIHLCNTEDAYHTPQLNVLWHMSSTCDPDTSSLSRKDSPARNTSKCAA